MVQAGVTHLDQDAIQRLLPDAAERFGFLIQFALHGSLQQQIDQIEHWLRLDCQSDPALLNLKENGVRVAFPTR